MIDLKIPKKKDKKAQEAPDIERNQYPYGFRLNLDKDQLNKLAGLKNAKGGDMVAIKGIGKVVEIRTVDRDDDKKTESMDVQIQQIDIALSPDAEFDAAFDEKASK